MIFGQVAEMIYKQLSLFGREKPKKEKSFIEELEATPFDERFPDFVEEKGQNCYNDKRAKKGR